MNVERLADRIRAEFEEMPGLMLTVPQASRLFGLDQKVTESVVDRLIGASYLKKTSDGSVVRATR